jgi:hypothetical protein
MKFKKIAVNVCFSVLLCIGYGYGQVYYKVVLDGDGDNGRLMLSSTESIISGSSTCASGARNCATIPIDGGKLGEYVLACVAKMGLDTRFETDGTNYTFSFHNHHCLTSVGFEVINGNTLTNIVVILKNAKTGKIVIPANANRVQQRKIDYMVGLLIEAIEPIVITKTDGTDMATYIDFHTTTGDVITDLYGYVDMRR